MNLSEIARESGVSLTTVSLVLNNRKGVGPARRREVARLLLENGYEIAEGEATEGSASRSIRFLKYVKHSRLVNENPGFVSTIIDSIEKECRRYQREVLISTVGSVEELVGYLSARSTGGILLLGTELDPEDLFPLRDAPTPLVVVDNAVPTVNCSAITMNNCAAIFSAVEHLASLGHPEIGLLANSRPSNNCKERRAAFEQAQRRFGLRGEVIPVSMTMDGAYASVLELIRGGARFPSALVANNDSIAVGAIRAFREVGLRVPADISVVGFDDIPFSGAFNPPLTTVSVPCAEIGTRAVRMLVDAIRNPLAPPEKVLVGTRLLVRESTCAFRGAPPLR